MTTGFNEGVTGVRDLGAAVQTVVDRLAGPLRRVMLQMDGCVVEVEWHATEPAAGPLVTVAAAASVTPPAGVEPTTDAVAVTAGLVGTFYGRPAPDAPPFVEVGDVVEAGQQVGVIETMKLFTPVCIDRPGRVAALLVKDGDVVEFGQGLLELVADS